MKDDTKGSGTATHKAWFGAAMALLALPLLLSVLAQPGLMGGAPGHDGGWAGRGGSGYGVGGMMGGAVVPATEDWRAARAAAERSTEGAVVDEARNTVAFSGSRVHIRMAAVQPGKPDTTFEVAGLVDPTLEVPRGSVVQIDLVNMDFGPDMAHGVVVTRAAPPYGVVPVPMMAPGGVPPLAPRSSDALETARYATGSATFRADRTGTYYYLCQVPGHAQQGMYGKLVVR